MLTKRIYSQIGGDELVHEVCQTVADASSQSIGADASYGIDAPGGSKNSLLPLVRARLAPVVQREEPLLGVGEAFSSGWILSSCFHGAGGQNGLFELHRDHKGNDFRHRGLSARDDHVQIRSPGLSRESFFIQHSQSLSAQ